LDVLDNLSVLDEVRLVQFTAGSDANVVVGEEEFPAFPESLPDFYSHKVKK
jgi:hypothetical protein